MSRYLPLVVAALVVPLALAGVAAAEDASPARRRQEALAFHVRAQERTGLLVPLYVYPANVHKNSAYNRLMELKRQYETVPLWVILNPASGAGAEVDANYTKAIDRLRGAGCMVLGYVTTSYGKRSPAQVEVFSFLTSERRYKRLNCKVLRRRPFVAVSPVAIFVAIR